MILIVIIVWLILVACIAALTDDKALTIVCAIALAGYFYCIHSKDVLSSNAALLIVYGVILIASSIYLFFHFIANLRHNRILDKQPASKQIVSNRTNEILNNMHVFDEVKYIQSCINDPIIKKHAGIAFYPDYENGCSFWTNELTKLFEPIEKSMIQSSVLILLYETGAFTLDEALKMCKKDPIIGCFSKLKQYIDHTIETLIDEKQIEKVHIGNNKYLYKNVSGIGAAMKSTLIEM